MSRNTEAQHPCSILPKGFSLRQTRADSLGNAEVVFDARPLQKRPNLRRAKRRHSVLLPIRGRWSGPLP
jgi:hypothetical protein